LQQSWPHPPDSPVDGDYGPFRSAPPSSALPDDVDDVDLGGELYTRRAPASSSRSGSDTRSQSRSSGTRPPHMVPLPSSDGTRTPPLGKRNKRATTSSSSTTSHPQSPTTPQHTLLQPSPAAIAEFESSFDEGANDPSLSFVVREGFPRTGFLGRPDGKGDDRYRERRRAIFGD
jgi:hypothetical protein